MPQRWITPHDMTGGPNQLGQRVLVLEDDFYLAGDTASALRGAGADVVGPFPKEGPALEAIHYNGLTGAIVDINLGSGPSFDIAHALKKAKVPFVFLTGYDRGAILEEFADTPRLEKPVELRQIVRELDRVLAKVAIDGDRAQ